MWIQKSLPLCFKTPRGISVGNCFVRCGTSRRIGLAKLFVRLETLYFFGIGTVRVHSSFSDSSCFFEGRLDVFADAGFEVVDFADIVFDDIVN